MAKKTIKAQMKQRRDTKANWAATNPVLLDGELGIVSDDPNLYKVGDGATAWNSLPFRGFDGTLAQELGTSPNAVISQKVVSEKLTELESEIIGQIYESSGANSSLNITRNDLVAGNTLSVSLEEFTSSYASMAVFLFRTDGTYITIGSFSSIGETIIYDITESFSYVRIYNSVDISKYKVRVSVNSLFSDVSKNTKRLNSLTLKLAEEKHTSSASNNNIRRNDFVAGNSVTLKIVESASPVSLAVYAYRSDNSYVSMGALKTSLSFKLSEDFSYIKLYQSGSIEYTYTIGINSYDYQIDANTKKIDSVSKYVYGEEYSSETNVLNIFSSLLSKGKKVVLTITDTGGSDAISVYLYKTSSEYVQLTSFSKSGQSQVIELEDNASYIKLYANNATTGLAANLTEDSKIADISFLRERINPIPRIKVLVLGDSYSANGGRWIRPMIDSLPNGSSWKSLAVSSATIKDKYADRNAYPYTSRPVSTENSGNLNTLSCQIEKLKRLMKGSDLDSGESQWYATPESYPNVIIIEGGMNDGADAETNNYFIQFEKKLNNVYIKRNEDDTPQLGSCFVKTPLDEVDRTNFAGAYRYIAESLLELFPDAHIFVTTCSMLGYWSGSVVERRYKTAEQQRMCANLLSASVIDWNQDGQINAIVNYPQGDGTIDNPIMWGEGSGKEFADTDDAMHPNARGGEKYGELAALAILTKFFVA